MSIGDNIKKLRDERGMDFYEFSSKTGIEAADVILIESGKRAITSAEIEKIAAVLGVSVDALLTAPQADSSTEGSVLMPIDELRNLLGKMKE